MKYAVIAIGYNRESDFKRLIRSLIEVDYENDRVDLIMSIDNSGDDAVEKFAKTVEWEYGDRVIRTFEKRQGLRQHILLCGDYLDIYDAVAVFEDDIYVSPMFFKYTKACVEKYADDEHIAGISLYTHLENVYARYSFVPDQSPFDVFFMQIAQSWGQVWLRKQWKDFISWYLPRKDEFEMTEQLPSQLAQWGKNSWLKYHDKYCAENKKYFVYPYNSLTTCFCSAGEHSIVQNDIYQVPMQTKIFREYSLPEFGDAEAVYYDAFYERLGIDLNELGISEDELLIDLYGLKGRQDGFYRYILTSRELPYVITKKYARSMRPHERNIIENIEGDNIFLYDTSRREKLIKKMYSQEKKFVYYNKIFANSKLLLKTSLLLILGNIKTKITKKQKG